MYIYNKHIRALAKEKVFGMMFRVECRRRLQEGGGGVVG